MKKVTIRPFQAKLLKANSSWVVINDLTLTITTQNLSSFTVEPKAAIAFLARLFCTVLPDLSLYPLYLKSYFLRIAITWIGISMDRMCRFYKTGGGLYSGRKLCSIAEFIPLHCVGASVIKTFHHNFVKPIDWIWKSEIWTHHMFQTRERIEDRGS